MSAGGNAGGPIAIGLRRDGLGAEALDLIPTVRWGFVALVVIVVVAAPWIHYLNTRQYLKGYLHTLAMATAQRIEERVIARNPEYWPYEGARLLGVLERPLVYERQPPAMRIDDQQGRLVISTGPCAPPPCFSESTLLRDAGAPVGTLQVETSLPPLLIDTLLNGAAAAVLGLLAIALFLRFPMRVWRRADARMRFLAEHDALTGVLNRAVADRLFEREAARANRYELPLALVMLDVDHFKRINDTHGHLCGDEVLCQLTAMLAARIRASDALVRWGGEEFVILAPNIDLKAAGQLAEKLRAAVAGGDFGVQESVTISLGAAALCPNDTLHTLARRADAALYRAKSEGRNRWATEPPQSEKDTGEANTD